MVISCLGISVTAVVILVTLFIVSLYLAGVFRVMARIVSFFSKLESVSRAVPIDQEEKRSRDVTFWHEKLQQYHHP